MIHLSPKSETTWLQLLLRCSGFFCKVSFASFAVTVGILLCAFFFFVEPLPPLTSITRIYNIFNCVRSDVIIFWNITATFHFDWIVSVVLQSICQLSWPPLRGMLLLIRTYIILVMFPAAIGGRSPYEPSFTVYGSWRKRWMNIIPTLDARELRFLRQSLFWDGRDKWWQKNRCYFS